MKNKLTRAARPFVLLALIFTWVSFKNIGNEGNAIPKELVGEWQYGTASMTEIWDKPTNTFLGNSFELSVRFHFKADGTYEEYFVAGSRMIGSCRINIFNISYGTLQYDAATKRITTIPNRVKNKFYNCGSLSQSEKTTELKSNTYELKPAVVANGTKVLEIKNGPGPATIFYKK